MKTLFIILSLLVVGCSSSSYQSVSSDQDEFHDSSKPKRISIKENYIAFRDPLKMVDSSQMLPYAFKKNGNIIDIGLSLRLIHDSQYGKRIFIRKGNSAIFLADGERIELKASYGKADHSKASYNTVTNTASSTLYDFSAYSLSKEQYQKIAYSKSLKIRIEGSDGYEEFKKFLPSFQKNLQQFYENEL